MTADRTPRQRAAVVGVPLLAAVATAARPRRRLHAVPAPAGAAAPGIATSTATVVRTDLSSTIQVAGALGYRGAYGVVNEAAGTAYTALPATGTIAARDSGCTRSTARRSRCSTGRPAWRSLSEWVLPGPDVAQLDRNLIALGFGKYLTVSDYYTAATSYAVGLWQQAAGGHRNRSGSARSCSRPERSGSPARPPPSARRRSPARRC